MITPLLIVIYHPPKETIKNIKAISSSVKKIYIFDNSALKSDVVEEILKLSHTEYISFNSNKGIGYPLNYIAQKATEEGFEWLLYLDQDSYFEADSFNKMIFAFEKQKEYKKEKVGIVSPLVIYDKNQIKDYELSDSFKQIFITINSGSLFNLKILKKLGGVREDFFLDRIDFEYCLRLNKYGYYVLRYNNSILYHKLGDLKILRISGLQINVTNHPPERHYYMTKNAVDIVKNYFFDFPSHCFYEIKSIITDIIKIIFFEEKKYLKIKYIIKALTDVAFKN